MSYSSPIFLLECNRNTNSWLMSRHLQHFIRQFVPKCLRSTASSQHIPRPRKIRKGLLWPTWNSSMSYRELQHLSNRLKRNPAAKDKGTGYFCQPINAAERNTRKVNVREMYLLPWTLDGSKLQFWVAQQGWRTSQSHYLTVHNQLCPTELFSFQSQFDPDFVRIQIIQAIKNQKLY